MTDPTPFSRTPGNAPKPAPPQPEPGTALLGPPPEAELRQGQIREGHAGETESGQTQAGQTETGETETNETQGPVQVWMHRISVFLFVLISAVAGVLLIILPWTPEWTDNYLLLSFPALRDVVSSGFFRGICSGLGLLDIWIGFWEALHYHEEQ